MGSGLPGSLPSYIHFIIYYMYISLVNKIAVVVCWLYVVRTCYSATAHRCFVLNNKLQLDAFEVTRRTLCAVESNTTGHLMKLWQSTDVKFIPSIRGLTS